MTNQHKVAHAGFTVVELLTVIAAISVLAVLLLPTLENALESARETACKNQLRQVHMGVSFYATGQHGCVPASYDWRGVWNTWFSMPQYYLYYAPAGGTPRYIGYGLVVQTGNLDAPRTLMNNGMPDSCPLLFCPAQNWYLASWRYGANAYDAPNGQRAFATYYYTGAETNSWPSGNIPKRSTKMDGLASCVMSFDNGFAEWPHVLPNMPRNNHARGFYNAGFFDGRIIGVPDPDWQKTRVTTYYAQALEGWFQSYR